MHLRAIDYVLWFSAPVVQIGTLWAMYIRGLHREYPYFASYLLVQVMTEPVLFLLQRASYTQYYYGYWVSLGVNGLLIAAVLYEVVRILFHRGVALPSQTVALFATLLSLIFVLDGVWIFLSTQRLPD